MDETFRLDEASRARVAPHFDVDALERLLQHLDPSARPMILEEFLLPEFGAAGATPNTWRMLKSFVNPALNELLGEVWQPFWDTQSDEMLADPDSPYPGRDFARRRRAG